MSDELPDESSPAPWSETKPELYRVIQDPSLKDDKIAQSHLVKALNKHWAEIPFEETDHVRRDVAKALGCSLEMLGMYMQSPQSLLGLENMFEYLKEDSFLFRYLKYTITSEAPEIFHLWTALTMLGAILNRRVYMGGTGYHFTYYPNLYTILVAPPNRCHKSAAIGIGADLCRSALPHLRYMSHFTTERLFNKLSTADGLIHPITGKVLVPGAVESQVFLVAKELKTVLGSEKYKANITPWLTLLFDCDDSEANDTLARKEEKVRNLYVSLIGATTPDDLRNYIPAEATGGGFTSRCILVHRTRSPRRRTLEECVQDPLLKKQLVEELKQIYEQIQGRMENTPDGQLWWNRFENDQKERAELEELQGDERVIVKVRKVAMLLAASEHQMQINGDIYSRAYKIVKATTEGHRRLVESIDTSEDGKLVHDIMTILRKPQIAGLASLSQLTHMLQRKYNGYKIRQGIETLEQSGSIEIQRNAKKTMVKLKELY